jgi:hypothetical protein
MTKAHSLRVEEKRTAISQQWVILVWDGPSTYLLAAYVGDTYEEVRDQAVAFIEQYNKDVAARREALLNANYG